MDRRLRHGLAVVFIILAHGRVEAACIDAGQLDHASVSIVRYFDEPEREAQPGVLGIRGTSWFLSPTTLVTAEHVVAAMKLSTQDWMPIELVNGDGNQTVGARIQRVAGTRAEKLAVIELQNPIPAARSVPIRTAPLAPDEEVATLAYPDGRPRFVSGRFRQYGDDGKLAGAALLEMYEGDNRLVIDHGASGAPVVDCQGRVVAVVTNVFTQSLVFASREIRISTAWGMPNVVSVPIQALEDFSQIR